MAKKKNMRGNDEVDGTVDMSPMIDCCFLLLIFFVVNATAITVAKDKNVTMPSAAATSDLKDAKGCIVINIFKDVDKMTPDQLKDFQEAYPTAGVCWSGADAGGKTTAYTAAQESDLTDFIRKERERYEASGMDKAKIRLYLRGDINASWERSATAIRCGAAAGVSNIVFGTLPAKK